MSRRSVTLALGACLLVAQLVVPGAATATTNVPEQLTALADTYLDVRGDAVTGSAVATSGIPMTTDMAALVEEDLDIVQQRIDTLAAMGEEYTYADTTLTVGDIEVVGGTATAEVSELTYLGYAQIVGDEPAFTAYQSDHVLEFTQSEDGTWLLAADNVGPGLLPITMVDRSSASEAAAGDVVHTDDAVTSATVQYSAASDCGITGGCDPSDAVSASSKFAPSLITEEVTFAASPAVPKLENIMVSPGLTESSAASASASYRYGDMINYAVRYWDVYNGDYRTFGNDCTNFISQTLRAGGWQHDTGWYRSSSNWWYNWANQTWTWAGAENWSHFAPKRTSYLDNVWKLVPSDMLQIDFGKNGNMNHSMVVTKRTSTMIYLTYHTDDHLNKSLRSIIASYPGANNWYYAYRT